MNNQVSVVIDGVSYPVLPLSIVGMQRCQPLVKQLGKAFGMMPQQSLLEQAQGVMSENVDQFDRLGEGSGSTRRVLHREALNPDVLKLVLDRRQDAFRSISDLAGDPDVFNSLLTMCMYSVPSFFVALLGLNEDDELYDKNKGEVTPGALRAASAKRILPAITLMVPKVLEVNFGEVGKRVMEMARSQMGETPPAENKGASILRPLSGMESQSDA